ncbi:MAG: efflux RND transporter periplasmic adaptor subunit [Proteobacteria bacterium]|nr:efflux RND transporter periplasmic adaptor subunit [Pseudomonadota bacterium]
MSGLRNSWLFPVLAVAVLLVAVAWMAGAFKHKIPPSLDAQSDEQGQEYVLAEQREIQLSEAVPGTLAAKQATLVSSRVMARITEITVRAGDSVKAGDIIVLLEQEDAKARLAQAKGQVDSVQARATETTLSLERALMLHKKSLIAIADVDKARANKEATQAELIAANQQVAEAEAAWQFTEIRAPINGTVVDRFAEPGDTATPGTQLLALYNPLTLRVEAAVREQLAVKLVIGQVLAVSIPSLDKDVTARIDELVPAADPGSRSFLIKAGLNFDAQLRPGMYAEIQVPGASAQEILVPASSVVSVGQLNVIWVKQDGKFIRRFVKLGAHTDDSKLEILSGLSAGEQVLIRPPIVN